jgi:hypothetical protein
MAWYLVKTLPLPLPMDSVHVQYNYIKQLLGNIFSSATLIMFGICIATEVCGGEMNTHLFSFKYICTCACYALKKVFNLQSAFVKNVFV